MKLPGLFHQAILHSGTDMVLWSHNTQVMAANLTRQISINLECPTSPVTAMVDCLKALPEEDVRRASTERYVSMFVSHTHRIKLELHRIASNKTRIHDNSCYKVVKLLLYQWRLKAELNDIPLNDIKLKYKY